MTTESTLESTKRRRVTLGSAITLGVVSSLGCAEPCSGQENKLAVIRGRCVEADSGKPLAGCKIVYEGWPYTATAEQVKAAKWMAPGPLTTAADGRFEVRFIAIEGYLHRLQVTHPVRSPKRARWRAFQPDQTVQLGDVRMAKGMRVNGRVVDTRGKPVAGVSVVIPGLPLVIGVDPKHLGRQTKGIVIRGVLGSPAGNRVVCQSDAALRAVTGKDGRFEFSQPVPGRGWGVRVQAPGFALVRRRGRSRDAGLHITLELDKNPTISGRVVDQHGRGIGGIQLATLKGSGYIHATSTLADGSFTFARLRGGFAGRLQKDAAMHVVVKGSGLFEPRKEPTTRWGAKDVRIALHPATAFEVKVVKVGPGIKTRSAEPLEEFTLGCRAWRRFPSSAESRVFPGPHRAGRVRVDGVRRGWNRVLIVPKDPKLEIVRATFEITDAKPGPHVIKVRRLVPMKVHVLDSDGKRLVGALVQVIDFGTGAPARNLAMMDYRSGRHGVSINNPGTRAPMLVSSAKTNAGGHCIVYGIQGYDRLGIYVRSTKRFLYMETDVEFGPGNQVHRIKIED